MGSTPLSHLPFGSSSSSPAGGHPPGNMNPPPFIGDLQRQRVAQQQAAVGELPLPQPTQVEMRAPDGSMDPQVQFALQQVAQHQPSPPHQDPWGGGGGGEAFQDQMDPHPNPQPNLPPNLPPNLQQNLPHQEEDPHQEEYPLLPPDAYIYKEVPSSRPPLWLPGWDDLRYVALAVFAFLVVSLLPIDAVFKYLPTAVADFKYTDLGLRALILALLLFVGRRVL